MRKIKQLVLILIATAGLLSCEAEKIDEVVKDDSLPGKAILRFQLNGITRVAKGDDVKVFLEGNFITLQATIKDVNTDFSPVVLKIKMTKLATGFYPTNYTSLIDPQNPVPINQLQYTYATFKDRDLTWEYSTQNVETITDMGSLVVNTINVNAQYFEGTFSYTMNPPKEVNGLPLNPVPSPIKIENGYFEYVKYETSN